jgi:hypothetical protein
MHATKPILARPVRRCRGTLPPRLVCDRPDFAIAHHITLRLVDARTLAPSMATRRRAASAIYRVGSSYGLLAFAIADTHVHLLVDGTRAEAGELARRTEISLQQILPLRARFEEARVRPVEDLWHLYRSVLYVFRQASHHGIDADAEHDGTSLPELLGLRRLDGRCARRMRALLPRLDLAELGALIDFQGLGTVTPDHEQLAEAAAAAFGLAGLRGRGTAVAHAKKAAVHAAAALSTPTLARLLDVHRSHVARLRSLSPCAEDTHAVALQLRLRSRPRPGPTP